MANRAAPAVTKQRIEWRGPERSPNLRASFFVWAAVAAFSMAFAVCLLGDKVEGLTGQLVIVGALFFGLPALAFAARAVSLAARDTESRLLRGLELLRSALADEEPSFSRSSQER